MFRAIYTHVPGNRELYRSNVEKLGSTKTSIEQDTNGVYHQGKRSDLLMPTPNYDDRRVEVYFGPSDKVDITKEELAGFIIEDMALEWSDGGPKWTEGGCRTY